MPLPALGPNVARHLSMEGWEARKTLTKSTKPEFSDYPARLEGGEAYSTFLRAVKIFCHFHSFFQAVRHIIQHG